MNLVLRCVALDEQTLSLPLVGRFDERGGTLGRSDEATLTLPDPGRRISRLQARILQRDGQYWLENLSDICPVLHNAHPVGPGMQIALRAGDELSIGGYTLQTTLEDGAETDSIVRGRHVTPQPNVDERPMSAELQTAIESLVDRLHPLRLEALLGEKTLLDRLWPMRRARRRWNLFVTEYEAVRAQATRRLQRSLRKRFQTPGDASTSHSAAESDDTIRPDETARALAEHTASASRSDSARTPPREYD
jgi:predicted component of type VI protein secretion system